MARIARLGQSGCQRMGPLVVWFILLAKFLRLVGRWNDLSLGTVSIGFPCQNSLIGHRVWALLVSWLLFQPQSVVVPRRSSCHSSL